MNPMTQKQTQKQTQKPSQKQKQAQNRRDFCRMLFFLTLGSGGAFSSGCGRNENSEQISVPKLEQNSKYSVPNAILCDGAGCMRLAVYLNCASRVAGVESIEKDDSQTVPYRIAHPELRTLPIIGESHGRENVEAVLTLNPRPEIILRTKNTGAGMDPKLLESRTGIRVLEVPYGDLGKNRETFYSSLRLLGKELGVSERAEAVIEFFEKSIAELERRCAKTSEKNRPSVFLGGLSYRGAHGFNSTSAFYPPFEWTHARNAAETNDSIPTPQMMVTREQILAWNPETIFVDFGTFGLENRNGLEELSEDPIYRNLEAVKNGRVFALYPNASYNSNFEARLANAWFIGKTLHPEAFSDVDFDAKIREIFRFLTGSDVLNEAADFLKDGVFRPVKPGVKP